ncbi:MAG TPA: hypothetical protein VI278_09800 [Nitrososphaeraceae archaeon]
MSTVEKRSSQIVVVIEFFPTLLKDPTVPAKDKDQRSLIEPFNPYIRRHSDLTEKSIKLHSQARFLTCGN